MGSITENECWSSCLETTSEHIWGMKILCKSWKLDGPVVQVLSFSYFLLSIVPFSAFLESYSLWRISSFPISSVSNISWSERYYKCPCCCYVHIIYILSFIRLQYSNLTEIGVKHHLIHLYLAFNNMIIWILNTNLCLILDTRYTWY